MLLGEAPTDFGVEYAAAGCRHWENERQGAAQLNCPIAYRLGIVIGITFPPNRSISAA